jgi:hypothetical protein
MSALVLVRCDGDELRVMPAPAPPEASVVGMTTKEAASGDDACVGGSQESGDIDGDGRPDTATLQSRDGVITVRLGAGPVYDVAVSSLCPGLVGFSDVNGDGADELWWKDGVGNTAHVFNLVAWAEDRPLVVVEPDAENPLLVGWGFSGGATLWCADANRDGLTEIIQHRFSRDADGQIGNERESVYELRGATLVRVSEGPARTAFSKDSGQSLSCGPVTWP